MTTRTRRLVLAMLVAIPFIMISVIYALLVRAGQKPNKPEWMPETSVWVWGPHTPLEFHRVGEWIGCRAGSNPSIKCWFTDDNGTVTYSDEFVSLNGSRVDHLQIAQGEMSDFGLYSQRFDVVIHIVRLEDGTILAPTKYTSEFGAIQARIAARDKAKSAS